MIIPILQLKKSSGCLLKIMPPVHRFGILTAICKYSYPKLMALKFAKKRNKLNRVPDIDAAILPGSRHTQGRIPRWLSCEESACQCRRHGFDPYVGKIPWRRGRQPLQYFCLENPMDRGAWWAAIHGAAKSQTQLSMHTCRHPQIHKHTHIYIQFLKFLFEACPGGPVVENLPANAGYSSSVPDQRTKIPYTME